MHEAVVKTSVALTPALTAAIDEQASKRGLSRSAMLRQLVELGLRQLEKIERVTEAVA